MTAPYPSVVPNCFRHPGRETLIRCQRCGRPICPECMIPASVGFHCPVCVNEGVRQTRSDRLPFGGRRAANPQTTSWVLVALNAAVWLLLLLTGGDYSPWYNRLALLPMGRCVPVADPGSYLPNVTAATCRAAGSQFQWIPGVADGAYWQLLTSAFTHVTVLHIGSNMLMLAILGPVLERSFGRARFLLVYLLSGLASGTTVYWLADPASSTVGASGALFGVLGALFVVSLKVRGNFQSIATIVGINLVVTFFVPDVSWQGHLGGLVGGALLGAWAVYAPRERRALWLWAGAAVFLAVMLGLIAIRTLTLQ